MNLATSHRGLKPPPTGNGKGWREVGHPATSATRTPIPKSSPPPENASRESSDPSPSPETSPARGAYFPQSECDNDAPTIASGRPTRRRPSPIRPARPTPHVDIATQSPDAADW